VYLFTPTYDPLTPIGEVRTAAVLKAS
jgi:hypothetical protein